MKLDFWHQRWEQNQIGFHQREINTHLQQFWQQLVLPERSTVFVPLCGKSRDLLWLRAQGHKVLGVEISPIACAAFFEENGLQPDIDRQGSFQHFEADGLSILCGDFFQLTAADLSQVDGAYDRASLVALPPAMRLDYVRHLDAILPAAIRVLLVTMEYPQVEMDGPPFSVHEDEVQSLFEGRFNTQLLFQLDILAENLRFQQKGLSALQENAYLLSR